MGDGDGSVRDSGHNRTRGQAGFTLVEGLLVVVISSIAVLSIALGLQTSVTLDNRSNEQQRLNLAITTFGESVKQSAWVWPVCPANTTPPASTAEPLSPPPSHAHRILDNSTSAPEVAAWVDVGIVFIVTGVSYWDNDAGEFSGSCSDADYRWPVLAVSYEACWERHTDGTHCVGDVGRLTGEVVKRGPRDVRIQVPNNG